jgi:hypothetical protein
MALVTIGGLPMCLGYLAWIVHWRARLAWLAPVGRMALTHYLGQSLLCTWLFYHYGLGWFEVMPRSVQLLFALLLFAVQVAFRTRGCALPLWPDGMAVACDDLPAVAADAARGRAGLIDAGRARGCDRGRRRCHRAGRRAGARRSMIAGIGGGSPMALRPHASAPAAPPACRCARSYDPPRPGALRAWPVRSACAAAVRARWNPATGRCQFGARRNGE